MTASNFDLSIIIPSYNEEARLPETLQRIAEYLPTLGLRTEVLVVDDGSTDRTAAVAESFRGKLTGLRVLSNGTNRGKGYSVRHGMLEAQGDMVLFTDADLSAPIEESDKLLTALNNGYDVAIGSRAMDRSLISTHQSIFREFAGIIFNKIVRIVCACRLWIRNADSKLFGGSVAGLFSSNSALKDSGLIRNCYTWRGITDCAPSKFRCAGGTHPRRKSACWETASKCSRTYSPFAGTR